MIAKRLSARTLRGESARYERPRTEKEEAILQAATAIFCAKGYRDARTADIAASAGVTERTLFRYFPTKDQLYAEARRRGVKGRSSMSKAQLARALGR